eukprot:gene12778-17133_t
MEEAMALLAVLEKRHNGDNFIAILRNSLSVFNEDMRVFNNFLVLYRTKKVMKELITTNIQDLREERGETVQESDIALINGQINASKQLSDIFSRLYLTAWMEVSEYLLSMNDFALTLELYGGATTAEDASEKQSLLKRLFHPDSAPGNLFKERLTLLFQRVVSCRDNFNPQVEDCDGYVREGTSYIEIARNFAAVGRSMDGTAEKPHIDRIRDRNLSSGLMTREEVKRSQIEAANRATDCFRAALRLIDPVPRKLFPGDENHQHAVEMQILLRSKIASGYNLGERYVNAQVYYIGAIAIASKWMGNYNRLIDQLSSLQNELSKLQQRTMKKPTEQQGKSSTEEGFAAPTTDAPTPPTSSLALTLSNMDTSLSLIDRHNRIRRSSISDRNQWIVSHILKTEVPLVPTNSEELTVRFKAQKACYHGLSMAATAGSMASFATVAVVAGATALELTGFIGYAGVALSFAGGPIGLGLSIVGLFAFASMGSVLWGKADSLRNIPAIRIKLNSIVKKAIDNYMNNQHADFLSELSSVYFPIEEKSKAKKSWFGKSWFGKAAEDCTPQRLMHFEEGKRLYINIAEPPKKGEKSSVDWDNSFINQLMKYGFRSDGISFILSCVAESMLCGKLKFESAANIPQSELNLIALKIYSAILNCAPLEEQAIDLDTKVAEERRKAVFRPHRNEE